MNLTNWTERVTAIVAILAVLGALGGVWLNSNNAQVEASSRLYNLEKRVEKVEGQMNTVPESIAELKTDMRQMKNYASQSLDVQRSLAASVNELAVQVGKLQERTSK